MATGTRYLAASSPSTPAPASRVMPSASPAGRAIVLALAALVGVLAMIAASAGLLWPGAEGPVAATSVRGESVELYGRGLYQYDTPFKAGAHKGADAVTLALGIPLLAAATILYRRGSLRGALLLLGVLGWFLYGYASLALGAAYNDLFLVYVALLSASLFAFVLTFASIDARVLASRLSPSVPRCRIAAFMLASGLVTVAVWLVPLAGAALRGRPPAPLDTYTVTVTDVLDLGVIAPAVFASGWLILRRSPLGYAIACSLLVLEALLAPMIAAQTAFQLEAGVSFTAAETVGPIAGFGALAFGALWALGSLYRGIGRRGPSPSEGGKF